jgi:hypothetical protein
MPGCDLRAGAVLEAVRGGGGGGLRERLSAARDAPVRAPREHGAGHGPALSGALGGVEAEAAAAGLVNPFLKVATERLYFAPHGRLERSL